MAFSKSNRAVKVATNANVELSADDQGATEFLMFGCRAWEDNLVTPDMRSNCYSLVEKNRPDYHVRHAGYFLYSHDQQNTPIFNLDSSFIHYRDAFLRPASSYLDSSFIL